jgi:putative membrane protein
MDAISQMQPSRRLVPGLSFAAYAVAVAASAWRPHSAATWLSENAVAWIIVLVLAMTWRTWPMSDRAYVQGLLFLLLHSWGAHHTYPLVPLGEWAQQAFQLQRNPFDRVVHFAFGLLLFVPLREVLFRRQHRTSLASELLLTLGVASMVGVGYELLEWGSAVMVGTHVAADFLGAQGDAWDTQADLSCNLLGGLLAVTIELGWAQVSRTRGHAHTGRRDPPVPVTGARDGARPAG